MSTWPINALTVDVEDYFHVTAFEGCLERGCWPQYPLRAFDNTLRVLDLFDELGLKATFFVLGWVAERLPRLTQEIARRGHEVACHGYGHQRVYTLSPQEFRADLTRARALLQDQSGQPVNGYRAPSYSITNASLWALDILAEEGFSYDSSIFPIIHDTYGICDACRFPFVVQRPAGQLWEFPLSTLPLRLGRWEYRLPVAGGGYLRFLPAPVIRQAIRHINGTERQPAVLYFHPWEIDPEQPRIRGARLRSRFRHYLNLHRTEAKLRHILAGMPFTTMAGVLERCAVELPTAPQVLGA